MKKILFIGAMFLSIIVNSGCHFVQNKEYKDVSFIVDGVVIESRKIILNTILEPSDLPNMQIQENKEFDGWYCDEDYTTLFERQEINANIVLYGRYKLVNTEEEEALEKIFLPYSTYQSIILPDNIDEYPILWVSSHPSILDCYGNYFYQETSQSIVLTAKIISNKAYEKSFEILVEPYPYEEIFYNIKNQINFTNPISENLNLLISVPPEVHISWESSDHEIVSNLGVITKRTVEQTVLLTMTLSAFGIEENYTFNLIIAQRELTINDPEYFIQQLEKKQINKTNPILTDEQITMYNQTILNSSATKTVDLNILPNTISRNDLLEKIQYYNFFTRYNIYNHETNQLLTNVEKESILLNRNLNEIPLEITVKYAVSVTHTLLRSYPTLNYSIDYDVDRFQETGFSLGTPMVVYHISQDKNWYFVQMFHYFGWVQSKDIRICSKEVFLDYVNPNQFIIALQPTVLIQEENVRMGYKIPYQYKTESHYALSFPKRLATGYLSVESILLEKSKSFNDGYLTYQYENLISLAFEFIGTKYSWGDKSANGFDCSSTQAAIYACFGFRLGRNTSNQWGTNVYGKSISSISNHSISEYAVGTLFYTSGHVLMYIGTDEYGNAWMLHNTSIGNICKLQTLNSYGTSSIKYLLELQ